jgi:predicted neuraminidase
MLRKPIVCVARLYLISLLFVVHAGAESPLFETTPIFPANSKHNHSSCVVETGDGSLLATWYAGSGERKADDVVIDGAWLKNGSTNWNPKFTMADTPGYPDCNPALFAPPDGSIWLFWPTILDHNWEGALLKFAKADHPPSCAAPIAWSTTGVLHVTPIDFAAAMKEAIESLSTSDRQKLGVAGVRMEERSREELYQRLGWMPRVRAIALPSGRWILPLYSDTFDCSLMMLSDDQGKTWSPSAPLLGFGNIQPSVVRKDDGTLVAFMRDNGPHHRIRLSHSNDEGRTWSPVTDSPFPNPGAGVEVVRLANGHWVLVYNDLPRGRHSLALSLSDDEGATWKWTRHVMKDAQSIGQYHYPSITQDRGGVIQMTYTWSRPGKGSTIQHARFDERFIVEGDAN